MIDCVIKEYNIIYSLISALFAHPNHLASLFSSSGIEHASVHLSTTLYTPFILSEVLLVFCFIGLLFPVLQVEVAPTPVEKQSIAEIALIFQVSPLMFCLFR